MRIRRPSHTTLVAYLALFVALGGSAYAAVKIGSAQIRNNSIRSADLKNGKAVGARDVKNGAVGNMNSSFGPSICNTGTCAKVSLRLKRRSHILAVATGGEQTTTPPNGPSTAQVLCSIELAGHPGAFSGAQRQFGEASTINTSDSQPSGLALTEVSKKSLGRGRYKVELFCSNNGARVVQPTISALAISAG